MRAQSSVAASILCALFTVFAVTEAGKDIIEITEGRVTFTVFHYDDDRFKPYKVTWSDPKQGFTSTFTFKKDGSVTELKTDDTKYNVKNSGSGKKKKIKTKGKMRGRTLFVEEGDYVVEMIDGNHSIDHEENRRRLDECSDCENAVNALAGNGVSSVCDLVDYGDPFDDMAATAIGTFCDLFGLVSGEEACEDQCDG